MLMCFFTFLSFRYIIKYGYINNKIYLKNEVIQHAYFKITSN